MSERALRRRYSQRGGIIFRFLNFLFFVALLAILFVFRHPIMRFAGEMWVLNDSTSSADAIVVLGDDNYASDRAFRGAELYRQGVAHEVVASGRMLRPQVGMAEVIAQDLQRYGIPAASIVKSSYDTDSLHAQADSLKELVASRGWKRLLVVTSNYDTRRARFVFQSDFPADVSINVSAAADRDFEPSRWWQSHTGQKIALTEMGDYVAARVEALRR